MVDRMAFSWSGAVSTVHCKTVCCPPNPSFIHSILYPVRIFPLSSRSFSRFPAFTSRTDRMAYEVESECSGSNYR